MFTEELEPQRTRYRSDHATLELWSPLSCRPPVLVVRVEGHAKEELCDPLIAALDEALTRGPVVVFDDWEGVTGYDSAVRIRLTEWTRRTVSRMGSTHILLASKILSMGVSLASRAAGLPVTMYPSRFEFERVLRSCFPHYRSSVRRAG